MEQNSTSMSAQLSCGLHNSQNDSGWLGTWKDRVRVPPAERTSKASPLATRRQSPDDGLADLVVSATEHVRSENKLAKVGENVKTES